MLVPLVRLNLSNPESFSLNQSFNDSNEDPLFPQRPDALSRTGHTIVAIFLGMILFFGFFNNLLVLFVFAKFRSLWTPINLILLNISVSDILVCIFGTPFSFAANVYGRWLIGDYGCQWYGFANSLFGEFTFQFQVGKISALTRRCRGSHPHSSAVPMLCMSMLSFEVLGYS